MRNFILIIIILLSTIINLLPFVLFNNTASLPLILILFKTIFFILTILTIIYYTLLSHKPINTKFKSKILSYKTSNKFNQLFQTLYKNKFYKFEKLRKKLAILTIIQMFFLFLTLYSFFSYSKLHYYNTKNSSELFTLIQIDEYENSSFALEYKMEKLTSLSFIFFIITLFCKWKLQNTYTKQYKSEIISEFVMLLNPNLTYQPTSTPTRIENVYRKANFDEIPFNNYYEDDYIEGFLDENTYIQLADISAQYKSSTDKHKEELFKGIFAFTKSIKNINTSIKIKKDKLNISNNTNLIKLDNQTFEKYFDVYSEDSITTLRILSADIMADLIDFYEKYKLEFEIIFKNDTIYLRFLTGNMFEPKIFNSSINKNTLFIYYSILEFVLELTKKVNHVLNEIDI